MCTCTQAGSLCEKQVCFSPQVLIFAGPNAGNFTPAQMMAYWDLIAPPSAMLSVDSYFGSHRMAHWLALRFVHFVFFSPCHARGRGFLMLCKRNTAGIPELISLTDIGNVKSLTTPHPHHPTRPLYSMYVWKSPSVGHKPVRAVPVMSNTFGTEALVAVCL